MPSASSPALTLTEFLKLPETKPASEYINGRIIPKPMPQGKHSAIQGELVSTINSIVKPKRIARAFPELRCTFGDRVMRLLRDRCYDETRPFTVGESARIQTFPDDWQFMGGITSQYKQIENEIPVNCGDRLGRAILSALT